MSPTLKHLIRISIFAFVLLTGCKDIYDLDKYQAPDWLTGKLYTQIADQEELSTFALCLELTGYDTIIDVSGSFTVFAPTDEAFSTYLAEKQIGSVEDIPLSELEDLVKFHIIQDAWSVSQFRSLDLTGWIDPLDEDSEPRAYKRQTVLRNPNEKYFIRRRGDGYEIVDSIRAEGYRMVYTRSRKYAPIFYDEYLDLNNLNSQDYAFYFERPYEAGNIYYGGGKIDQQEIFAENGFVYRLDQVVEPMLNGKELMERELSGETYSAFLELVYQYPEFETNLDETYKQTAAREGGNFDTLYNLYFPKLPFDLQEEMTGPSYSVSNFTYQYQNGIFIPTNDAFQTFIDEVVTASSGYPHWPSFSMVPEDIKIIIVNTHFANIPIYSSDIQRGFENGEGYIIHLDEADIIRKEYGSNCTFLGLNKTVEPRAFSSVTGPVYLRPGYSTFMYAMQYSRVTFAITKEGVEYGFFPVSDQVMAKDSSLIMNWVDRELNRYNFKAFSQADETMVGMSAGTLAKRIMNQVSTSLPNGSANKEFLETLAGNYIIWNNADNTVQGGKPNTFGYNGVEPITLHPEIMEEPTDNGKTWDVGGWFSNTTSEMASALSTYPLFSQLLKDAGLYDEVYYTYNFLVDGEFYTVFAPSDQALLDYGADTLQGEDLEQFLLYHFIKGQKIFTDNKMPWMEYESLREDESSSEFTTLYSTINLRPGRDQIEILDANGQPYILIPEDSQRTNILVGTDTDISSNEPSDFITTGVIHEIDQVLIKQ